jgi:hypothetical protein
MQLLGGTGKITLTAWFQYFKTADTDILFDDQVTRQKKVDYAWLWKTYGLRKFQFSDIPKFDF